MSSGQNNTVSYIAEISRKLRRTCKYFVQKKTPCKHVLCIMAKVFNVEESSYILQQIVAYT